VRTLVISDLHLGMRSGHDVLHRGAALEALRSALRDADRLVLLGDTVELYEAPRLRALRAARPVLQAIGAAAPDGGIVLVPGNHDGVLIRNWVRARRRERRPIGTADAVPAGAGRLLEYVVESLRPARVEVRYPGVWLAGGVWATHGHYVDRHLVTAVPRPLARGRLAPLPEPPLRPEDYERGRRVPIDPARDVVHAVTPLELRVAYGALRRMGTGAFAAICAMPGVAAFPAVAAWGLDREFRRAGLRAMAEVVRRLGVEADHVVFGHLHRLGPRGGDDLAMWRPQPGGPRLWNTGTWVREPGLLTGSEPPHPYWPGGAVWIEDDAPPRAVGLLDDVPLSALRRPPAHLNPA
jgi:predicted phosphodiesterase